MYIVLSQVEIKIQVRQAVMVVGGELVFARVGQEYQKDQEWLIRG
jgi:hypothetical protein